MISIQLSYLVLLLWSLIVFPIVTPAHLKVSSNQLLAGNSSCYDKETCEECVGTTFSPKSGCSWCGSDEICIPDTEECVDDDVKNTCSNEYFVVIFVIVMSALLFLCCISCLLRKYNVREDGSLRVPLLGNDRSYLFRNSLFDSGEVEWMCIICGFDNRPRSTECGMCGTSQEFCVGYKENKKKEKKARKKYKEKEFSKEKVENLQPSTPIRIPPVVPPNATSPRPSLSSSERQQAFNYRRLNQLTLRQKSARRRRMWMRVMDEETGAISWVRTNFKDAMAVSKANQLYNESIVNGPRHRFSQQSSSGHSAGEIGGGSYGSGHYVLHGGPQDGRRSDSRDSFDPTLTSMSPGYSSFLNRDGDLQWTKVESKPGEVSDTVALLSHSEVDQMLPEILPQDLQAAAALPFNDKCIWFMELISQLQRPWAEGHIRLEIHRNHLLQESFDQFMGITRSLDLHRWMRVQFVGELGIDAGGLEREWFTLLCGELFNPQLGLFSCSGGEGLGGSSHINPISYLCNPQHLQYYHFTGRILAKSIMEQIVVPAMLSLPLRKQILSIPVTFSDLEFVDVDLYRNLCWLRDLPTDVEELGLVFAVDYQFGGHKATLELVPNGSDIAVCDDNKEEYLDLRFRHRMLDSVMPQLQSFLKGFYEVLPPDLVSVFDYQELELLMCGLPKLDLDDWKRHTEYLGEYNRLGPKHKVIKWFWEVVESFSDEERVRLLQFVTGSGGLPAQGFKALQSNDGNFRKFNIQSIHKVDSSYPRAHTCFNKIDLPVYDSKRELEAFLSVVINMEVTGFTID